MAGISLAGYTGTVEAGLSRQGIEDLSTLDLERRKSVVQYILRFAPSSRSLRNIFHKNASAVNTFISYSLQKHPAAGQAMARNAAFSLLSQLKCKMCTQLVFK